MHSAFFPDSELCFLLCLLANISRYSGGCSILRVSYAGSESFSGAVASAVSVDCVSRGKTICIFVSLSLRLVSSSVEGAVGLISAW